MAEEILDKKGVIRAIAIAAVAALIGIVIVGWAHYRFEKERLPDLEEAIEEKAAQRILGLFMMNRLTQNEEVAMYYLTERAAEQARLNEFSLIDDFSSYEILQVEKLEEEKYRFTVNLDYKELPVKLIEIITLIKVLELNEYYIDSVQIAG